MPQCLRSHDARPSVLLLPTVPSMMLSHHHQTCVRGAQTNRCPVLFRRVLQHVECMLLGSFMCDVLCLGTGTVPHC
jgi:hypothetical protein